MRNGEKLTYPVVRTTLRRYSEGSTVYFEKSDVRRGKSDLWTLAEWPEGTKNDASQVNGTEHDGTG